MSQQFSSSDTGTNKKTLREAYRPLPIVVPNINLTFEFKENCVQISNEMKITLKDSNEKFLSLHERNPGEVLARDGILLHGSKFLSLERVMVDSNILEEGDYEIIEFNLWIKPSALVKVNSHRTQCSIRTIVNIDPANNHQLSGLYKSNDNFVTQCEAEGFRNITYAIDRPDVMSIFTTKIIASRKMKTLLGNGNLVEAGEHSSSPNHHFALWHDPFPKPTYLFAVVVGLFDRIQDTYITSKGKKVDLHFYSETKYIDKLGHAITSLKRAMRWDEEKYGREYDLNLFNVVCIDDFNAGAMENKSLNIFNASLVVAGTRTATDTDFERIEGVVAHEYFHNWTGNRVTCRDWFQLTLKEGLTVYRDQEFSADMNSRAVVRLQNVAFLRARQFPEDNGAMRHPIRPDEYEAVDNFYTYTVYEKGAEVVRMYESLYGKEGFRKGMDLYFERHDGSAVTCDDFLEAMADANDDKLTQFERWYSTSGTPNVSLNSEYDSANDLYLLHVSQSHPALPNVIVEPLLIPIKVSFLHPSTGKMLLISSYFESVGHKNSLVKSECEERPNSNSECTLRLTQNHQTFIFPGLGSQIGSKEKPIISAFRGFSAPVKFEIQDASPRDTLFVLKNDTDGVNRFNASQTITKWLIHELYRTSRAYFIEKHGQYAEYNFSSDILNAPTLKSLMLAENARLQTYFDEFVVEGFRAVLQDASADDNFKASVVSFASITEMSAEISECDPVLLFVVVQYLSTSLAEQLENTFLEIVNREKPGQKISPEEPLAGSALRALVNRAYSFLSLLKKPPIEHKLLDRMRRSENMTDEISSLNALNYDCPSRNTALNEFEAKWNLDMLTMHKWYLVNASCNIPGNFERIERIYSNKSFAKTNPNNIYTLIGGLKNSQVNFHSPDYKGYSFLVNKVIEIDKFNSAVASRLMSAFTLAKNYTKGRQSAICSLMSLLTQTKGMSQQVTEIAHATMRAISKSSS